MQLLHKFEAIYQSKWNFDMEPCDRSLDQDKVKRYPSEAARKILEQTKYVTYQEFKSNLHKSFDRFAEVIKDKKFYLMILGPKIGSDHWCISILWQKIRQLNCVGIVDENFIIDTEKDVLDFVVIDDCMYTGSNILLGVIDNITYNTSKKLNKNPTQEEILNKFNFHVVVAYASELSRITFLNYQEYSIKFQNNIKVYKQIELPCPDLTEIDTTKLNEIEFPQGTKLPCCYFDHKIASSLSTYNNIYNGNSVPDIAPLFKQAPSRHKIQELEVLLNKL